MNITRVVTVIVAVLYVLFWLAIFAGIVHLFVLIVKALRKYVNSKEVREEKKVVAETLGVSRQSVSKWENGTSDPNTSNLMVLAKLYGISAEELLKNVEKN